MREQVRLPPDGEPAEVLAITPQGHRMVRIPRTGSYGLVAEHEIQTTAPEVDDGHTA